MALPRVADRLAFGRAADRPAPDLTGPRWDQGPFGPPLPQDRLRGWLVTVVLTLVAGVVRFWRLGHPTDNGTPVFDEKHYVPQAWQMLRNGGFEDNPGYALVVHPPLGKQLIAIGEALFGYDGFGWRAAAALAGTLCVLLIIRITRRMTRSTLLGAIAGILLICDGLSHVQSRMGMLDIFLALFVLAAFGALVVDRDDVRARLAAAVRRHAPAPLPVPVPEPAGVATATVVDPDGPDFPPGGPRLGIRWWRFAAGALLGLAVAVKWSGIYWVIAFAALSLVWDFTARRAAGVSRPWYGVLRRDLAPTFWALVAVPVLVYLGSWWAWFASETGIERHSADATGPFGAIPGALASLWHYTGAVLSFHSELSTPADAPHPWESKPWTWPMGLRPMLYYYASGDGAPGCGAPDCVGAVMLIGTPVLWFPALLVLAWAIWRVISRHDWRYGAVLVAYGAGVLPWFVNLDRQMYYFYVTPVAPFLVIAVTLVLGEILGPARAGPERRSTGLLVVALYVGAVVANFIWLWPILVGSSITPELWDAELWLPSWR